MKIFSKRKGNLQNDLLVFDAWWDNIKVMRQFSRHCFLYSVPLFLFSIATLPSLWSGDKGIAILTAGVMGLSALSCLVICRKLVLFGTPKQSLGTQNMSKRYDKVRFFYKTIL